VAVVVGQQISKADLDAGRIFLRNADVDNSFTFQVVDSGFGTNGNVNTDPTPNTLTIDVTPAPLPPITDIAVSTGTVSETSINNVAVAALSATGGSTAATLPAARFQSKATASLLLTTASSTSRPLRTRR
jgi:hypothetical protein